ncbi:MAG: DUF6476 family protein [Alphaproteobacteria bacterium]
MSETPQAADQETASRGPMPGTMRTMVMVVVLLGVIFVVGFLALVIALVVRAKGGPEEAAKGEPLIAENLTLPKDGDIRRVWTDSDRLIIHTSDPEGQGQVVVYDLRKGRVLARIGVQ